jgi:hypothetical protein
VNYYAIAYVPAAARSAAESAVAPYLLDAGEIWTVPLTENGTTITHYGCCAPLSSDGQLLAALPTLAASIPGSGYHTIPVDDFQNQRDWAEWLAARLLSVYREEI